MFDAGAIAFRLQMVGAEVFKRDAKGADQAFKELGESSEKTAKKVSPVGTEVDKAGKAAKGAKAPLDETGKSTKKLGEESEKAAPKVKKTTVEVEKLKRESEAAGRLVGTAAVGIGAAIAAMAVVSVAQFANFDEAMSKTGAATMANAQQQDQLGAAALQAGADTVFSATQAADAETELSKAGQSVSDILGGSLTGSLALAAAGELGVARAAEIAATTLTVFKLKGKDAGHVADLLAAGAGKAQGSVDDLALALEYVGPTFARLNIPLESTVGTLGLLAANGILGEKAGTGLRGVIQSLTAPVAKGAEEMKKYKINVFDAAGEFIGMEGAAGQLQKGLGGLDEQTRSAALGAIFGAESANVAGVLFAAGAEGVAKWTENVDDQGFAAEQAAIKTDNLNGDLEQLGGSMETALIKTGSVANDTLREMVQILTGLVNWYGDLDSGVQGTVMVLGIATGAVLILGGTMLLAIPKIAEFKLALDTLNTTMKSTALAGGAIGLAVTAVVTVLGFLAGANAEAQAKADSLTESLDKQTGAFTDNTREQVFNMLQSENVYSRAQDAGIALDTVTDAALGNTKALAEVREKSEAYAKSLEDGSIEGELAADAARDLMHDIENQTGALADSREEWKIQKEALGEGKDAADAAAPSYETLTESVDGVTTSVGDLAKELDALNGVHLDARAAARDLEAAYDDFDAAIEKNGRSLNKAKTDFDTTTDAGRENAAALDNIAKAAMNSGQAIIDAGGGYDQYKASLQGSRAEVDERIRKLGITGQAAKDLADQILHIPTKAEFEAFAKTAQAQADLDAFLARNRGRQISYVVNGVPGRRVNGQDVIAQADGGMVSYFANGGEHHVAQIAKAGTMRVWAEPETGGEAYIPLAGSKRGRSTAILADVAEQFGYQLVPSGAQSFADGGRTGQGGSHSSRGDVSVTFVNPVVRNPVDDARTAGQLLIASLDV